jgi:hypothetical protein
MNGDFRQQRLEEKSDTRTLNLILLLVEPPILRTALFEGRRSWPGEANLHGYCCAVYLDTISSGMMVVPQCPGSSINVLPVAGQGWVV